MFNFNTPINHPQGQVKESDQPSTSSENYYICQSHSAEGRYVQRDPANKNVTRVYCDACIIQFYHRSNTFLSSLDMSQKQLQNQQGPSLAFVGQQTIDNFNNSLMQYDNQISNQAFILDCQSNCIERNKEITIQQKIAKKEALYYLQNMQQSNYIDPSSSEKFLQQVQQIYPSSAQNNSSHSRKNFQALPVHDKCCASSSIVSAGMQNNPASSFGQQQQKFGNSSNQLNFGNGQLYDAKTISNFRCNQGQVQQQINSPLNELEGNYTNQISYPAAYSPTVENMSQENLGLNKFSYINTQNSLNMGLVTAPTVNFFQKSNATGQLNFTNDHIAIQKVSENSNTNQYQNQGSYTNLNHRQPMFSENPQSANMYNHTQDQNFHQNSANNTQNTYLLSAQQQQLNHSTQVNKINSNNYMVQISFQNQQGFVGNLDNSLPQSQQMMLALPIQNSKNIACNNIEFNINAGEANEQRLLINQSGLKKTSQKIKHATKFPKQQFEIINEIKKTELESHHISQEIMNEGFIDEEEMKIVLDHEYQQELHSKKRKSTAAKKIQQDLVHCQSGKKQSSSKNSQSLVIRKSKEIEKRKQDRSKKQQILFSSWCPQSQQLLFEWNNTPLKQISLQSDKIVNESVNVASYVNILSKNRIMIISQSTHSLKYQINLIDLQENRVICKNQLGQNFQLYPFEPSKLNVQTVKINERLSCIYLMGGSYFKIIKNSTLRNVKRVKQFCIQQILPIYKGRQVVALSLNGLINVYSTANDRFHLIQSMKIKRESPFSINYVNYFDVDTENSLIYCCVLSSRSQFIQIFNMFTGEIIYSQDIHILQQNYGYNITNMKIFQNHLYIELQLQQDEHHHGDHPIQFKVQAYKIDNQSHHLNEFKTYNHSNILKSTFSSKQFFLYNSKKSCIIGFEKLSQKKSKHYLTSSNQVCLPNSQLNENSNLSPSQNIEYTFSQRRDSGISYFEDCDIYQKIFKLNIKQTSPKFRPIFTHIFKEMPHEHQHPKSKNQSPSIFDGFSHFNTSLEKPFQASSLIENNLQTDMDSLDMVLTLFDQNKNVYKIFQN